MDIRPCAQAAHFEKVSFEQYANFFKPGKCSQPYDEKACRAQYDAIKLPTRATEWSAGYDFYLPRRLVLFPDQTILIATGIRVKLDPGWMLALFPRSGLGFKYGFRLRNTVGIIDGDYYYADNEGHIMARVLTDEVIALESGDRFMQGIIVPYGLAYDEDMSQMKQRTGGMGSTGA